MGVMVTDKAQGGKLTFLWLGLNLELSSAAFSGRGVSKLFHSFLSSEDSTDVTPQPITCIPSPWCASLTPTLSYCQGLMLYPWPLLLLIFLGVWEGQEVREERRSGIWLSLNFQRESLAVQRPTW